MKTPASSRTLRRKIINLSIATTAIIFTIITMETVFFILNACRMPNKKQYLVDYCLRYRILHQDLPRRYLTEIYLASMGVKYHLTIREWDKYRRRLTPTENLQGRSKYALFLGCSFTFGDGVRDNETLPYFFGEMVPTYQPYNYGRSGAGPQQMLVTLQNSHINKQITEKEGILIYTFLDQHINRTIGSMRAVGELGPFHPYFFINKHNELVQKGSFASGRPFLTRLYRIIFRSQLARFFHIELPPLIREQDVYLTYRIIKESARLYQAQFKNSNFYILFYPGSRYARRIIPYLENDGIKYLDYSWIDFRNKAFRLEGNPHPAPLAYRTLAERIAKDLGIHNPEKNLQD